MHAGKPLARLPAAAWLMPLLLALLGNAAAQVVDPLPSWSDGATRTRIVAFVTAVTEPGSKDFVPAADRIAVFDKSC